MDEYEISCLGTRIWNEAAKSLCLKCLDSLEKHEI